RAIIPAEVRSSRLTWAGRRPANSRTRCPTSGRLSRTSLSTVGGSPSDAAVRADRTDAAVTEAVMVCIRAGYLPATLRGGRDLLRGTARHGGAPWTVRFRQRRAVRSRSALSRLCVLAQSKA